MVQVYLTENWKNEAINGIFTPLKSDMYLSTSCPYFYSFSKHESHTVETSYAASLSSEMRRLF